jgi:hypothetical protein
LDGYRLFEISTLDQSSTHGVLTNNYARAVAKFVDLPFSTLAGSAGTSLNIVPNSWSVVEARLKARGIL